MATKIWAIAPNCAALKSEGYWVNNKGRAILLEIPEPEGLDWLYVIGVLLLVRILLLWLLTFRFIDLSVLSLAFILNA